MAQELFPKHILNGSYISPNGDTWFIKQNYERPYLWILSVTPTDNVSANNVAFYPANARYDRYEDGIRTFMMSINGNSYRLTWHWITNTVRVTALYPNSAPSPHSGTLTPIPTVIDGPDDEWVCNI